MEPILKKHFKSHYKKTVLCLNSLNLQNNYQDCILKLIVGRSVCYNRVIITGYTVHVKMLKAFYFSGMVWFPFPRTTDAFHLIFSYDAT